METDDNLRARTLAEYDRRGLRLDHAMRESILTDTGSALDLLAASLKLLRIGTRRVSKGWIDEWNGISWRAKGYNPTLPDTVSLLSDAVAPITRIIDREVVGDERDRVEAWARVCDHARVYGYPSPLGLNLREGNVIDWRFADGRLFVTINADISKIAPSPDPFGDAVRAAQQQAREDDIIPHPVSRPQTKAEIDALWDSIMGVGRGA